MGQVSKAVAVGRHSQCDVVLCDDTNVTVSRVHLLLVPLPTHLLVIDYASFVGTRVGDDVVLSEPKQGGRMNVPWTPSVTQLTVGRGLGEVKLTLTLTDPEDNNSGEEVSAQKKRKIKDVE